MFSNACRWFPSKLSVWEAKERGAGQIRFAGLCSGACVSLGAMESGGKRVEYEALEERICKRRRRRRRTKYFRVFFETVKWGLPY